MSRAGWPIPRRFGLLRSHKQAFCGGGTTARSLLADQLHTRRGHEGYVAAGNPSYWGDQVFPCTSETKAMRGVSPSNHSNDPAGRTTRRSSCPRRLPGPLVGGGTRPNDPRSPTRVGREGRKPANIDRLATCARYRCRRRRYLTNDRRT